MLDSARVIKLLQNTEIFGGFQDKHLQAIAKACKVLKFEARSRIVTQGDPGEELYIVASGEVAVVLEDRQLGIEQLVLKLGPGQSFGEVSLLAQDVRSATVKATSDTFCVVLAKPSFDSVLRQIPEVGVEISRYLAARLHKQCQLTGFRFVSSSDLVYDQDLHEMFSSDLLNRIKAIPLSLKEATLTVAFTKPNDVGHLHSLREVVPGLSIEPVACTTEDYEAFREKYRPSIVESLPQLDLETDEVFCLESGGQLPQPLNGLLVDAHRRRLAQATLLFSNEGCKIFDSGPAGLVPISEIAGMDQSQRLLEQIRNTFFGEDHPKSMTTLALTLGDSRCTVQSSLLETLTGFRCSIRMLDSSRAVPPLVSLIPNEMLRTQLLDALRSPGKGIVLAGAARTGTTTTAYSLLRCLTEEYGLDVIALEKNPLVRLDSVSQVRVCSDLWSTFEAAASQFPGLLFVDDLQLCDLPELLQRFEASQTTLGCIQSDQPLLDLMGLMESRERGYPDFRSLDLLCHQRTLPKQCPHCRQEHQPAAAVTSRLVREQLAEAGQTFFRSAGCPVCRQTGFLGKAAVFEVFAFNSFLREMISARRPLDAIRKSAKDNGLIIPFESSARLLLANGDIGVPEALRYFGGQRG